MREFDSHERAARLCFPGEMVFCTQDIGRGILATYLVYRSGDGKTVSAWRADSVSVYDPKPSDRPTPLQSETGYEDRM